MSFVKALAAAANSGTLWSAENLPKYPPFLPAGSWDLAFANSVNFSSFFVAFSNCLIISFASFSVLTKIWLASKFSGTTNLSLFFSYIIMWYYG